MHLVVFAITWLRAQVGSRIASERGQDLLEYALLGGLIAAALLAAAVLAGLTGAAQAMVDGIKACVDFDKTGTPCNPPG